MSSSRALQEAVVAALVGSGAYMALVTSVYDGEADESASYPWALLGEDVETDASTHDIDGHSHLLTVHEFSVMRSSRELQLIREARAAVLDKAVLTLSGWSSVKLREVSSMIQREWDDELKRHVRHQISTYRTLTLST